MEFVGILAAIMFAFVICERLITRFLTGRDQKSSSPIMPLIQTSGARIYATYPMFGDLPGLEWANIVFGNAELEGRILDYYDVNVRVESFGLQYVSFTLEVDVEKTDVCTMEDAQAFVNALVNDSDVEVQALIPFDLSHR